MYVTYHWSKGWFELIQRGKENAGAPESLMPYVCSIMRHTRKCRSRFLVDYVVSVSISSLPKPSIHLNLHSESNIQRIR